MIWAEKRSPEKTEASLRAGWNLRANGGCLRRAMGMAAHFRESFFDAAHKRKFATGVFYPGSRMRSHGNPVGRIRARRAECTGPFLDALRIVARHHVLRFKQDDPQASGYQSEHRRVRDSFGADFSGAYAASPADADYACRSKLSDRDFNALQFHPVLRGADADCGIAHLYDALYCQPI